MNRKSRLAEKRGMNSSHVGRVMRLRAAGPLVLGHVLGDRLVQLEVRDEIPNLARLKRRGLRPCREKARLCGLLQLFRGIDGRLQVLAGHDGPMVDGENRAVSSRKPSDRVGNRRIAGR